VEKIKRNRREVNRRRRSRKTSRSDRKRALEEKNAREVETKSFIQKGRNKKVKSKNGRKAGT